MSTRGAITIALFAACLVGGAACNTILGVEDVTGPGGPDAAIDAPPAAPLDPALRAPQMGASTGSVHAPQSLRPRFSWRATGSATHYELVVDDSCVVSSFQSCVFPSPEVSETNVTALEYMANADLTVSRSAPVGRRYYWRVRACNDVGCGVWSETWYLNVGRLDDDVNGDGYGDLVVGIEATIDRATQVGAAYLVFGDASATASSITALPDPVSGIDARFGAAVAMVGDVNADGYGDVAVGAWQAQRTPHNGFVSLYLGRGAWPATLSAESAGFGLPPGSPADFYGSEIAGRGDMNGDGYSDFGIAALPRDRDPSVPGYVYVTFGRATISGTQLGADLIVPDPEGHVGSWFGGSLSLADLDHDGLADLVVGAPGHAVFEGAVTAYFGRRTFAPVPFTIDDADVDLIAPTTTFGAFGSSTTICRSPSTATALAIGSPGEHSPGAGAGAVRIYSGREPWPASVEAADRTIPDPAQMLSNAMGRAVTCADLIANGKDDLVVSAPTGDDAGAIYVFSETTALPSSPTATLTDGTTGTLGKDLAATDFNGDGAADIFAGKPRANSNNGTVVGWLGRTSWPTTITAADLTITNPSPVADERFGRSLD